MVTCLLVSVYNRSGTRTVHREATLTVVNGESNIRASTVGI